MTELALASIAFNAPRAIAEQKRLLEKYLEDDYSLLVVDRGTPHVEGLNYAASVLLASDEPYIGFLDHDVYPTKPTRLIPLIEEAGFYGVGQRHAPTGRLYPWPGFCFFSREWLAGRPLDFGGIRGDNPADNGDTGSNLWPLFETEDWHKLYLPKHSYELIRKPDDYGLQSFGFERIGDWLHLTNASHWMAVPDPEERDRLLYEMLAAL